MEATSLAQFDTEYSADSIEFCPTAGYEHLFTCGTYQLLAPEAERKAEGDGKAEKENDLEKKKEANSDSDSDSDSDSLAEEHTPPAPRVGRLYLFELDGTAPVEKQRMETAAILDAKWSPTATTPELLVADAKGGLTEYTYSSGSLSEVQRLEVADESTLVLSLDPSARGDGEVITSLSSGELAHIVRDTTGVMEVSSSWAAHDFEPWITAWAREEHTVWSGGDDLRLKRWDLRMTGMPTAVVRCFEGGVTTIAPSPHDEHLLAVGSYDARLRLFDVRNIRSPLGEIECPGGIWRTRWNPNQERKNDILNACMHGGFAVVRVEEGGSGGEVVTTFPGTLGYGADWCRTGDLVATCSFYDHVMHVWRA